MSPKWVDEHNALYDEWVGAEARVTQAYRIVEGHASNDERAEAARLRFLGCDAADAVPWAELKPAIRERWLGVLEAVTQPMDIDTMAREASWGIGGWGYDNWDNGIGRDVWRTAVRRALAAGGLEPCAVPEYEPADVALRPAPTDADVEALAQIIRAEYEGPKRYEWQYSAYKDEWRAAARAAFAHIGAVPVGCPECAARREHMMKPQPVIECAMCAEWEKDCRALSTASRNIDARIAARAALEGDA
jgi:hypothetical protein